MKLTLSSIGLLSVLLLAACTEQSATTPSVPTTTPSTPATTPSVPVVAPSTPAVTPSTPATTPALTTVQGTIQGNLSGADTVTLRGAVTDANVSGPLLASAPLTGSSFKITLPSSVDSASLKLVEPQPAEPGCGSTITLSRTGVSMYTSFGLDLEQNGAWVGYAWTFTSSEQQVGDVITTTSDEQYRVYATDDLTISGREVCGGSASAQVITAYDARLVRGWNLVNTHYVRTFNVATYAHQTQQSFTTTAVPTTTWEVFVSGFHQNALPRTSRMGAAHLF